MLYLWAAAAVVFILIEAVTVQLVCVWFFVGAAAALGAQCLGAGVGLQIFLFFAVSVILLVLTRPLANKLTHGRREKTNADSMIGREAVILDCVDNIANSGSTRVGGVEWSVKSADGSVIQPGARVRIENIEGVKLVVKSIENADVI